MDNHIDALQGAAKRCDDYEAKYGLYAVWSIRPMGLRLDMSIGSDKISKYVDWIDIRHALRLSTQMKMIEEQCMKGLSD